MKLTSITALVCGALVASGAFAQPPAATPPPAERGADRSSELAQARRELAEAARKVAELSAGEADRWLRDFEFHRMAVPPVQLGVYVDENVIDEGVRLARVSSDGPASAAGLREGDVLTELNGKALTLGDDRPRAPAMRIYQALADTKAGDAVRVRYQRGRDSREATVTLAARSHTPEAFSFGFGDGHPSMVMAPDVRELTAFRRLRPFGNYEFVRVSEDLGEYFNTERGLLVVSVGEENPLSLKDGDVILTIDGREPESTTHAARILRSYAPGESASIEIMRNRRRQTVEVAIPE